jgi:LuxR family maltose regulon positive regulatory protein
LVIARLETTPLEGSTETVYYSALLGCHLILGVVGFITSTDTMDYRFVEYFKKAAYYSPRIGYTPEPPVTVANIGSYVCRVWATEKEKIGIYLQALEKMVPYAAQALGGFLYGLDELAQGEYAFFRGELTEAETHIREALKRAREQKQYEIEQRSLFYLLRIAIHRENHREIIEIPENLKDLKKQKCYTNRSIHYDVAMGWFYTQMGDTGKLASWLKNDFEESEMNSRGRGLELLVKAKYHIWEKKYPAALAVLTNRKDFEGRLLFGKLETLALEAVCHYNMRDREGSLAALTQSYQLSEQSGITMPFIELGRYARALADWALKEGPKDIKREWLLEIRKNTAGYAKKLFSAAKIFKEEVREEDHQMIRVPVSRPSLSRREREVLSCLSRGLTRIEIASTLSISINTVKSIIRSIYNKLGAVNRSHAIQVATTEGLLKNDN